MTIDLDWSDDKRDDGQLQTGAYLIRVAKVEERRSAKGDRMLNIRLEAVDWQKRHVCYDTIMLEGTGRSMGHGKLVALGVPKGTKSIDAQSLLGRKAYAYIAWDEYKGKRRLAVSPKYGSHCGYWLENERDYVKDLRVPDPNQDAPGNFGEGNPWEITDPFPGDGDVPF